MALRNSIFDKVIHSFDWLSPHRSHNQADAMVKMNMPPLMGRRDAAFDLARKLINSDLFALGDVKRTEQYQRIVELLEHAISDTRAILFTLSSPDTEQREHWQLCFLVQLRDISLTLGCLNNTEHLLFSGQNPIIEELAVEKTVKNRNDEISLSNTQLRIAERLRELCASGQLKIVRYRSYAAKSFSAYNSDRYNKSYAEYSVVFNNPAK